MSPIALPYTPEDEAFAERLVDEALEPYKSLPQHVRDDIKEYLVDELLATEDGRRRLRLARPHAPTNVSEERSIDQRVKDAIAERAEGDK